MNASAVRKKTPIIQLVTNTLGKVVDLAKIPLRTNSGRIGFAILIVYSIVVIFGSWMTPYNPNEYDLDHRFEAPSMNHLF